jgi:hypothetical protein
MATWDCCFHIETKAYCLLVGFHLVGLELIPSSRPHKAEVKHLVCVGLGLFPKTWIMINLEIKVNFWRLRLRLHAICDRHYKTPLATPHNTRHQLAMMPVKSGVRLSIVRASAVKVAMEKLFLTVRLNKSGCRCLELNQLWHGPHGEAAMCLLSSKRYYPCQAMFIWENTRHWKRFCPFCSSRHRFNMLSLAIFSICFVRYTAALNNGVGKLPKMGYDSENYSLEVTIWQLLTIFAAWNAFACDYDQDKVLAQAEAMVKYGLVEAGYTSIILDDCFTLKNRSIDGKLIEG